MEKDTGHRGLGNQEWPKRLGDFCMHLFTGTTCCQMDTYASHVQAADGNAQTNPVQIKSQICFLTWRVSVW
eukprot:11224691-Lingulodinium_polyedra.AAC.1